MARVTCPHILRRTTECFVVLLVAASLLGSGCAIRSARADSVEAEFWDRIKDSQDTLLLEMYLKAFPDGEHSRNVRERLDARKPGPTTPGTSSPAAEKERASNKYRRGEGGWVGVEISTEIAKGFGSDLGGFASGARVLKVTEYGPAARAGLAVDDVIVAIDGKATGKHDEFAGTVRAISPGTGVTVTVIRDGKAIDLPVTIGGILTDNLEAAEAGNVQAQWIIGFVQRDGLGVEKNQAEAVKWIRRAAEGGLAVAQTYLGYFYANGEGVEKNERTAVEWYRKAEAQNESAAVNNLGSFYEAGRGGLPASREQAIAYFRRSAALGFQIAVDNLARLKVEPYDLAEIQKSLAQLGHDPGPADGKMGSKTESAIREFQAKAGLPSDGKPSLDLARGIQVALSKSLVAAGSPSGPMAGDGSKVEDAGGSGHDDEFGKLKELESLD